jgi:hypothetical protein
MTRRKIPVGFRGRQLHASTDDQFPAGIRWDIAANPAFGPGTSTNLKRHQWSGAVEMLLKF